MKRGCWIAFWAIAAYVIAGVGVAWSAEFTRWLMKNITVPARAVDHVKLMSELARGLFPYIAASVVFVLGLGAHLPGTRVSGPQATKSSQ